jgi:flavin reductase (DIM6/NTAB) family NADH-FMN oxidoreductase RutF
MISIQSLFKISYGLYIVGSGDKTRGNGFIANTVFQVTAEPSNFAGYSYKHDESVETVKFKDLPDN